MAKFREMRIGQINICVNCDIYRLYKSELKPLASAIFVIFG